MVITFLIIKDIIIIFVNNIVASIYLYFVCVSGIRVRIEYREPGFNSIRNGAQPVHRLERFN